MQPDPNAPVEEAPTGWLIDWRKWGLGGSIELRDPTYFRLWLGPLRFGFLIYWRGGDAA